MAARPVCPRCHTEVNSVTYYCMCGYAAEYECPGCGALAVYPTGQSVPCRDCGEPYLERGYRTVNYSSTPDPAAVAAVTDSAAANGICSLCRSPLDDHCFGHCDSGGNPVCPDPETGTRCKQCGPSEFKFFDVTGKWIDRGPSHHPRPPATEDDD